jgi:3-methyladenine DNA glycosylase AlkD
MDYTEVMKELNNLVDPRYQNSKSQLNDDSGDMMGIGVTKLKKLAKKIKKNHELALQLWDTPLFECKLLSVFIEDPKQVTKEQIESQIPNSRGFMLADYFSEFVIVKTKFADELIEKWTQSAEDPIKKAGFALLYCKAKADKKAPDEFFMPYLEQIEKEIQSAENWVKESMNYAICHIGSRSKELNEYCLGLAARIGEVEIDYGTTSCVTVDATNWLKSDRIQKKL